MTSRRDGIRVSVVIPTLDEEEAIASALASAQAAHEVIVVDGGSTDRTVEIATAMGARVLLSGRGRGRQLSAGAADATGDVMLFLHADSQLPFGFVECVVDVIHGKGCSWGRFDIRFDEGGPILRLIAHLISWRSRWTRGATGDQAIFVSRRAYDRVGGFPEQGLFEDVALCRRLKRDGPMGVARGRVVTSARRWRRHGTIRTSLRMWSLKGLYLLGVRAESLERYYRNVR
jgi:rSAM/selenodomain-associated transferase 2